MIKITDIQKSERHTITVGGLLEDCEEREKNRGGPEPPISENARRIMSEKHITRPSDKFRKAIGQVLSVPKTELDRRA